MSAYPDLSNLRGSPGGGGGSGSGGGGSAYSGLSAFMDRAPSYGSTSLGGSNSGSGAGAPSSGSASTSTELSRKVTPDARNRFGQQDQCQDAAAASTLTSFETAARDGHALALHGSPSLAPPPNGGGGGIPSSTYLYPGTTSGGMSALTAAPSGGGGLSSGGLGYGSSSAYPNLGPGGPSGGFGLGLGGGPSGSASLTGLGASDSFAGEMLPLGAGGTSAGSASAGLYPSAGSMGTFAVSSGGCAPSGPGGNNNPSAVPSALHGQGTLGSLGSLPSFALQTTTAGTIDSGLFSIDEKMTSRVGGGSMYPNVNADGRPNRASSGGGGGGSGSMYPNVNATGRHNNQASASSSPLLRTTPLAVPQPSPSAAAAASNAASASASAFHGTLCANSDLVDGAACEEVLHAGFSDQMEAARCELPMAALAEHHAMLAATSVRHSQSLGNYQGVSSRMGGGMSGMDATTRAQATLLAQSTSYGTVETAASLEARQIAAAMAMSLRESSDAQAASGLRRQQSSAASSAITDALAAYSRASSAGSVTSAVGRVGSLGMTDPLDAVQLHNYGGQSFCDQPRKVSASSVNEATPAPALRASSSSGFDIAAAALSEYRRKESGSSIVSAPALAANHMSTMPPSLTTQRRMESEGSAIASMAPPAQSLAAYRRAESEGSVGGAHAAAAALLLGGQQHAAGSTYQSSAAMTYLRAESGNSVVSPAGVKDPPRPLTWTGSFAESDKTDLAGAIIVASAAANSNSNSNLPVLEPGVRSGPIKKRLKMGASDGSTSSNDDGHTSGSGVVVDCVPALPKFDRLLSADNTKMADDASISTAGSLARKSSGGDANPDSEFVLTCQPTLLYSPEDRQWLSDLLCFLRHQIEVFVATPEDVAARSRRGGIKEPIAVGRVGIRCRHCVHIPQDKRSKGAVSYPTSIRIVHQAVRNWQRYHFKSCPHISDELREEFSSHKGTRCHSGNSSLKYWIESCERQGMVDTPGSGIRLKRSWSACAKENLVVSAVPSTHHDSSAGPSQQDPETTSVATFATSIADVEEMSHVTPTPLPARPLPPALVESCESPGITPFLGLLLAQQQPTLYQDIDRLGKRRSRPLNFPGVECRHCSSRVASSGRYFPLTSTTLGNNNNPFNCVHSHLLKCRRCPRGVKDELNRLAEAHLKDGEGLPAGWKKRFFDGVWGRLHNTTGEDGNTSTGGAATPGTAKSAPSAEDVGEAAAALSALSGLSGMKRGHSQC